MINLQRLGAVARKETLHVLRDWRSLFLAIAIPIVLILLFGYALSLDLNQVPTVVWDQSRTPRSRELLALFAGSPYFSIRGEARDYRTIEEELLTGRAMVALVVPRDFAQQLDAGRTAKIQVLVDGSDSTRGRLAAAYATGIGMIYHPAIRGAGMTPPGGGAPPVVLEQRAWYNADLRSSHVIVPGIIAVVMIVIAAMLTSVTVAREWETGTMEQLISTPIRAPELVLGKVVPYFAIGMLDVSIAVGMGQWLFGVPLRGSTGLLFLMAAVFLTGALFFGLMLSVRMKSQVLANQTALLASYLPTLMLSGFVFSIANMPAPIQWLTYVVPARYFIALLRGIYLKGIGLEILWLNALLLAVYALVMAVSAHRGMKLKLG